MESEAFLALADLLSEPLLLLSKQGRIQALNRQARKLLNTQEIIGKHLEELNQGDPEALNQYLLLCSRSRDPLPGKLTLTDEHGRPVAYRCYGAVLTPPSHAAESFLLLRLLPRKRAIAEFTALNDKIKQLTQEISLRKQIETDLREQREKLRITLNSIGDGVIVTDVQGQITSLNPVAMALTGWGQEALGQSLERVFRIINENTRTQADNPVTKVIRHGKVVGLANHTLLIARDGTERPIDDSAAPIQDGEGALLGVVLVFRDGSEARQAAERLQESNERLQVALQAGQMGVWEWNIRTQQVIWSPIMEAIHGLAPGTFPGTFSAFQQDIHPADREHVLKTINQTLERRQNHHIEYRLVRPDGSIRWVEANGRLFLDPAGEPIRMVGVCLDITERKEAEQNLEEQTRIAQTLHRLDRLLASELDLPKLLQLMVDESTPLINAEIGAFFHKVDGRIEVGASSKRDGTHPHALEHFLLLCNTLLLKTTFQAKEVLRLEDIRQDPRCKSELLHRTLPEEQLPICSYLAVPVISHSGDILGALVFGHSSSGKFKEIDEQIMLGVTAQAAITIDNAHLYQEVKEASLRKDEFLAMLAHELRNPLAPIRTGLDLLGLNTTTRSADDSQIIHMMNTQVDHLVRLVDELLDVSRIMRGRIELKKEPLDLAQVIHQAVETVRSLIHNQQHNLTLSLPETAIFLNADPVRLTQILSNLLHNAAKYTPRGGKIRLSADREGKTAVIRVRDNGIGIEPSLLPWVFDLFSQSQRSMDRAQGGLGIGLTVARSLVEMHQGTLTVHSEGEGKGSEFIIRLPIEAVVAEIPSTQPPTEAVPRGSCILIVDDNPDIVRTQQLLFSSLGPFQIHTAQDGPTALNLAKAHRPDLILLDIGLPGMSGYEVSHQLRSDPQFQHTLLVALSGYGQQEDQRRSKEAGFDEHLVKPVSLETLLTLLKHPKLKHGISLDSLSRPLQEDPESIPPPP